MGTSTNKPTRQNADRKIVAAIQKYLSTPVKLRGVTYTPTQLADMFQKGIDLADAVAATETSWHAAVAAERAQRKSLSAIETSLRKYVDSTYGDAGAEFSDFGFKPKKVKPATAETKAEAVKKREGTRAARHTMGPRQKQKVKGDVSPPPEPTATTVTPVPATTTPGSTSGGPAKA